MKVILSITAQSEVSDLPLTIQQRVWDMVVRLESWPQVSGIKPLTGDWKGHLRVRTGDYRIIFRVERSQLVIERVAHRKDVYE